MRASSIQNNDRLTRIIKMKKYSGKRGPNKMTTKNKDKLLYCMMLFSIFLIGYAHQTFGQEKVNISVGIGLPELLNIGIRYQLEQTQIGISFGSLPLKNEPIVSISGDVYYHFEGISELSNRHPWYVRFGLNYLRDETTTIIDKYLYLNFRVGKDFNISKKIGIEADVGLGFQLSHDKIRKTLPPPSSWLNFNFESPIVPCIGIGVFYRI